MLEMIEGVHSSKWFNPPSTLISHYRPNNPNLAIVTGDNASGKSLVRKILHNRYHDQKTTFINTSQEARCQGGFQRAVMYGSEMYDSTGFNSIRTLQGAIKTSKNQSSLFALCIDEPEIGCSDDTQASLGIFLQTNLAELGSFCRGIYIITHSKVIAQYLLPLNPTHWCLGEQYIPLDEWINAKPQPRRSLKEILDRGRKTSCVIQSLIDEKKSWNTK